MRELTGYAYGAVELYGIARYTGIAFHTAVGCLVLHGGILAVSSTRGAMALFVDQGIGGTLLRRLSIPVVALPLTFGYLFMLGRETAVRPFHQADGSTRREHGGLGLGLSIARHLITLHGGTITASSDGAGRGASFTIALPADTAGARPSAQAAVAAARHDVAFS